MVCLKWPKTAPSLSPVTLTFLLKIPTHMPPLLLRAETLTPTLLPEHPAVPLIRPSTVLPRHLLLVRVEAVLNWATTRTGPVDPVPHPLIILLTTALKPILVPRTRSPLRLSPETASRWPTRVSRRRVLLLMT